MACTLPPLSVTPDQSTHQMMPACPAAHHRKFLGSLQYFNQTPMLEFGLLMNLTSLRVRDLSYFKTFAYSTSVFIIYSLYNANKGWV